MAKISGVPTLDPVSLPSISPEQAGRGFGAVAQLGQETNDIAQEGMGFELLLKKAQISVDETAFQNEAHASVLKYQDALAKTTNSRDVEDIKKSAQDDLNGIVDKWQKSPALVSIQMQAQGLLPEIAHLGTVKTADLQVKESAVQSNIQKQTLIPQIVQATRNGDKGMVEFTNAYMDKMYADREAAGLISHAEVEKEKNADQIQIRSQLNDAAISSADGKERLAAIQQLKNGGSGPLNLEGLAAGDIAALRTHAEETNRALTNLQEAGNLNKSLNVIDNAFAAPQYKNNYEARLNSLQDGQWLQQHGIVAEDGSPDRVMADKLIQETTRQRAESEKVQTDKDNKALQELDPLIAGNKLSHAQLISKIKDLSPRAQSIAESGWYRQEASARSENNQARSINIAERQERQRQEAYQSSLIAGRIELEMATNKFYEPMDIYETPGLSDRDKRELIGELTKPDGNPANQYITGGRAKIAELGIPEDSKYELSRVFSNQVKQGDLRGSQITDLADKLITQAKSQHSQQWIDQLYRQTTEGRAQTASEVGRFMQPMNIETPGKDGVPQGAIGKVPSKKDGRLHWTDGKNDLGVAQ